MSETSPLLFQRTLLPHQTSASSSYTKIEYTLPFPFPYSSSLAHNLPLPCPALYNRALTPTHLLSNHGANILYCHYPLPPQCDQSSHLPSLWLSATSQPLFSTLLHLLHATAPLWPCLNDRLSHRILTPADACPPPVLSHTALYRNKMMTHLRLLAPVKGVTRGLFHGIVAVLQDEKTLPLEVVALWAVQIAAITATVATGGLAG